MRVLNPYFLSAIALTAILFSCKKDTPEEPEEPADPSLEVHINPYFGIEDLELNQVFTTDEGYKIKFLTLKFFLEDIRSGAQLAKDAALFDFGTNGTLAFSFLGKTTDYPSLNMNLGVQSDLNHADPSLFASSSPLNIMNANDMHWDWNPGYIFVKVEAKADTLVDGIDDFDLNVILHAGLDPNLQTLNFSELDWTSQGSTSYRTNLKLDMLEFLRGNGNPIDLKTEYTTHSAPGQEALTLKVMSNLKHAITKL
jgi:hypothetical protein